MEVRSKLMHKFTNTRGDEILLFHIDRFLLEYPGYAKKLADVIFPLSDESPRRSAVMIQRRYYLQYTVADAMMKALKGSKAVLHLHEPIRDELCMDREQAGLLAEYVLSASKRFGQK